MVQLVTDFVNRFVEQVRLEHHLQIAFVLRNEDGTGCCVQITLQEDAAHLPIPEIGPMFEEGNILPAHGRLPERAVGGVLKRTHHACHIA